ncbi:MAG TPA: SRPBCC family protein [Edaphobacter sp.]
MSDDRQMSVSLNQVEAEVTIQRVPEDVFAFYADFGNLPRFLGDVMEVKILSPERSQWRIEGPFGIRAHWTVEVTERVPNERIRYEVVDSDLGQAAWDVYFSPGSTPNETKVREVLTAPMGKLERMAMALMGKFPEQEVRANLHRLKELLETGKITDTSFAVKGKFADANERP